MNKENEKIAWKIDLLKKHLGPNRIKKFSEPFLPDDNFYSNWDKNDSDSLRLMAFGIMQWLDIKPNKPVSVDFGDVTQIMGSDKVPGFYTEVNGQEIIIVDNKYKDSPFACGAILAHELMHYYLFKEGLKLSDTLENELLTDLATIYCGLGILIINGMQYYNGFFWTIILLIITLGRFIYYRKSQLSFGYFKPDQYGIYFKNYLKENNIKDEDVIGFILPSARKFFKTSLFIGRRVKTKTEIVKFIERRRKKSNIIKIIISIAIISLVLWAVFTDDTSTPDTCLNDLNSQKIAITSLAQKMDRYKSTNDIADYNELVPQYNRMINDYNAKLKTCN